MTILITRPQPDADLLAMRLRELGYSVLVDPLLTVQFDETVCLEGKGVQAILVTSINGVRALARILKSRDFLLYAVGHATAMQAYAHGFRNVRSAEGDVKALCLKVKQELQKECGLLIHASGHTVQGQLVEELCSAGFSVERKIIYHTQEAENLNNETIEALKASQISKILFFSPRTAAIFGRILLDSSLTHHCREISTLCLSRAIAHKLEAFRWKKIDVAEHPSTQSFLKLLTQ